jgi:two-component system LytT family sensor kinase
VKHDARTHRDEGREESSVIQEPKFLSPEQFLLTTLVVKIAVIALVATVLVRYRRFRHILIFERRAWHDRLIFASSVGIPLAAGVVARLLLRYDAADVTLEGAFVAGLIAGPYAGATVGTLAGLPAALAGEWIALPFAIGCGFAGGGLREACPKEEIWHFSPFVVTSLHRRLWQFIRRPATDWQVILLLVPVALEVLRLGLGHRFGIGRLFYLDSTSLGMTALVILATVLAVATPIKIWNNARIEHRLQEQEKLLLAAKIEALASQINPHFLFNTLTSISALIRSEPETARTLINKLSGLLRKLLRSHDHFVSLREELEAVDEYLDIEVVRFGPNLVVEKQIAPDTLDVLVPSMILQPLVENSIKHGLAQKVGQGHLTIRSRRENGHAVIEVADDGLGMTEQRLSNAMGGGIGLTNVNERLRVIYGAAYHLKLQSVPGQGTSARIDIPELSVLPERVTA